jgi:hypothetical protein
MVWTLVNLMECGAGAGNACKRGRYVTLFAQESEPIRTGLTSIPDSAFTFPCSFPIKVMGVAADDFDALVVTLIRRHTPDLLEGSVSTRLSRQGKYMSVTVTLQAQSRLQLDDIYRELTRDKRVLMAF